MSAKIDASIEVLFVIEGHTKPFSTAITSGTSVAEFAALAAKQGALDGDVDVFQEDADEPLAGDLLLLDHLSDRFAPLHVATRGLIVVVVRYASRDIERKFRAAASIGRITGWAVGPDGFKLEGDQSDYQLKLDGQVLSPDKHLGQVAHGHKRVEFDLVFKVKPQG